MNNIESFFGPINLINHIFGITAIFLDIFYLKIQLSYAIFWYATVIHYCFKYLSLWIYGTSKLFCRNKISFKYFKHAESDTVNNDTGFYNKIRDLFVVIHMAYNYRIFPILMLILLITFGGFGFLGLQLTSIFCVIQMIIYLSYSIIMCTTKSEDNGFFIMLA